MWRKNFGYCSFWKNYFNFEGRATRKEYWYAVLGNVIISVILSIVDAIIFGTESGNVGILSGIFGVAGLIPGISVCWRRMHDIDKSGAFYFLGLIPLVGWIIVLYFLCKKGTYGPNRYGSL